MFLVFGLLAVSGALAYRSLQQLERSTLVVARLDPQEWTTVTSQMTEATEVLRACISDRIDR